MNNSLYHKIIYNVFGLKIIVEEGSMVK